MRTESCPISFEDSARVPMSLPVENNTETQFDVRSPIADGRVSGVVEGFGNGADVFSCGSGYRNSGCGWMGAYFGDATACSSRVIRFTR